MSKSSPTNEQWKALYDLSAKFRQMECWRWMSDEQLFGVRHPETGKIGYCCVIGNLGEELGLIVYTGSDGLDSFMRVLHSQDPNNFENFAAQKCLSITYDNKNDLPEEDLAVINELGMEFTGYRAYPVFRNLNPGYFPWFITAVEADFLCIVLDQAMEVCLRCRENPDLLSSPRPGLYLVREPISGRDKSEWTDRWLPPDPLPVNQAEPPLIDEVRVARIKAGLKKGRAKWEFSYALENMPIRESGRPYYPLMLFIVDTNSGLILDSRTAPPHSFRDQFVEYFLESIEKAGMYPQEVFIENDEAMIVLKPVAARLDIKLIKVNRCKESAKARKAFREHLP